MDYGRELQVRIIPVPSGYRLPTSAEFNAEEVAYNMSNSSAIFASVLKLVNAGVRATSNGDIYVIDAFYWTSTTMANYSVRYYYSSSSKNNDGVSRSFGLSVRCIKD